MPATRMVGAAFLSLALLTGSAWAEEVPVDLELVLAVDMSRSMDTDEQALQRQGYISALTHPEVIQAIGTGPLGRIAVTYVEWSGPVIQRVIAPWAVIDSAETAAAFAAKIVPTRFDGRFGTSISSSLVFAAGLFDGNGFAGERRTIDISGDGPNNSGVPVTPIRDMVVERGIVINGLPIMLNPPGYSPYSIDDLDVYYRDCVIGGPGSFLVPVRGEEQMIEAIRRKLILEVASALPRVIPADVLLPAEKTSDCLIGEKLWRRYMDP